MPLNLINLLDLLRRATTSEDVFGVQACASEAALKRRYRELANIAHPDHNLDRMAAADEAFKLLQTWYAAAQRALNSSATPYISATTKLHRYTGDAPPLPGDLCDLFPADADGERVLLKVAREPRNHDLLQAEARVLQRIARELNGQAVRAHFPRLVETFALRDTAGVQRHTNVLCAEKEYVTLKEVLHVYPRRLDARDAAWMFNRLLVALAVTHDLGVVHGAVLPAHVLVRPNDHNGMLIDWCYSVPVGEPIKAISVPHADDYPPEVRAKQGATPATDLYMAARCLARLLGSDGTAERLPASVPKPIVALLRACLLPAPARRASSAWDVYDEFREILGQLYGPATFRPFVLPATT